MARNAWRVWGVSAVVAGGLIAADKPDRTEVSGRSTPAITQEHFQADVAPPPRLLPNSILEGTPSRTTPTAERVGRNVIGVQTVAVDTPDLDIPIRATKTASERPFLLGSGISGCCEETVPLRPMWKALAALEVAEMHFRSCDAAEARKWYLEVVKLAPGSDYAAIAAERLEQTNVIPAGATESREPPLADAAPVANTVRIR